MTVRHSYKAKSVQIGAVITPELQERMDNVVDKLGTSRAQFIRDAVTSLVVRFEQSFKEMEQAE